MSALETGNPQAGGQAQFSEVNGTKVVRAYDDVSAEYAALRKSAAVLDLSFRSRICLAGADRTRFLHGQVTNDINKLKPGQGCYAALVNARGKIESDFNVYCLESELLLDFEPGLAQKVTERFEKFIIADDVQVVDVSTAYGLLSVQGPRAVDVVSEFGVTSLPSQILDITRFAGGAESESYCARVSRIGTTGFDLFLPLAQMEQSAGMLVEIARKHEGRLVGWEALEIARIEAGIPRFGQDMDEMNLAPEAGIDSAISYNKGCYIGQEVISRIRAYGQVAKALRGLQFPSPLPHLPQKGAKIFFERKEVGYVTSAIQSPSLQKTIALGYVRREHHAVGTKLSVLMGDAPALAQVVPLPFVPA